MSFNERQEFEHQAREGRRPEAVECPLLTNHSKLEAYGSLLRQLLSPLDVLNTRERLIVIEHTYWKTNHVIISTAFNISTARMYVLKKRALDKLKTAAPHLF